VKLVALALQEVGILKEEEDKEIRRTIHFGAKVKVHHYVFFVEGPRRYA
jgi:hypothetical protein